MATHETIHINVGDTLTYPQARWENEDGTDKDISAETITFSMYGREGSAKVEDAACEQPGGGADGVARYLPNAIDVDTAGIYSVYFKRTVGGRSAQYPQDGSQWRLHIHEVPAP